MSHYVVQLCKCPHPREHHAMHLQTNPFHPFIASPAHSATSSNPFHGPTASIPESSPACPPSRAVSLLGVLATSAPISFPSRAAQLPCPSSSNLLPSSRL